MTTAIVLTKPVRDHGAPTISVAAMSPDLECASVCEVLAETVTTPVWPGAGRWGPGNPPLVTSAANATSPAALTPVDGGARWHDFHAGKDFS